MYSTSARSSVAFRVIGCLDNTQTTAGTWASAGTKLCVGNYGKINGSMAVFASYNSTAGQAVTTSAAVIDYGTIVEDALSTVTVGSGWRFTAPFSGLYSVSANAQTSGTIATGDLYLAAYYVGAELKRATYYIAATTTIPSLQMNTTSRLLAGQTIEIYARAGSSVNLSANARDNNIQIARIGN
jgi:hypothetical protein